METREKIIGTGEKVIGTGEKVIGTSEKVIPFFTGGKITFFM